MKTNTISREFPIRFLFANLVLAKATNHIQTY